MTDKERLKKIAIAFLTESQSDYKAVSILIKNRQYNLAIYHAQQSVEKLLKACLAVEGKIGIYKHEIFYFFREIFVDKLDSDDMKVLEDNVPELEKEWADSRYPEWENEQIWIPSEEYSLADATKMKERMGAASKILKKFLKERHGIKRK